MFNIDELGGSFPQIIYIHLWFIFSPRGYFLLIMFV